VAWLHAVTPSRRDLETFVRADGWEPKPTGRGRTSGDHDRYRKRLPDGSVLNTKISHPVDDTSLGTLWESTIRTLQLEVTEEQFWDCIASGKPVDRSNPYIGDPVASDLPTGDLRTLAGRYLGVYGDAVDEMGLREIIRRLNEIRRRREG
jgi:hypothetical protein